MSDITELFEAFYKRYELPRVEPLTIGFSDIDPPLKQDVGKDHEKLENLLGGSEEDGHYHLTLDQLQRLTEKLNVKYPPKILEGQSAEAVAEILMTPYEVLGIDVKLTD